MGKRGALNRQRQTGPVAVLQPAFMLLAAKGVVVGTLAGGLPCGTAGATLRPVTLWQLFRCRKLVRARRHGACARWPPGHTVNRVAVLYSADIPVMPGFNVEWAFITKTTHGSPCSRLFEDRLSMSKRKRQRNRGRQRGQAAGSRPHRVARPLPRSEVPTVREVAAPLAAAPVNSPVPSPADAWKEQYGYVGRDLKLMSVTSAVLFAAIVVASFYLR